MNLPRWLLAGAIVAAIVLGAIAFLNRSHRPVESAQPAPTPEEATPRVQARAAPGPPAGTAPSKPASSGRAMVDPARLVPKPSGALRVRAGRVLASVNGKSIELKDLVPLETAEQEKTMAPEEYESRLNRAIEMELTYQAAAAERVDLTAEQKRRVESIPQKHEATMQEYRRQGLNWTSVTQAQSEFEKRVTSAQLLQQNLVARAAAVAPSADLAVQARYEQALRELLERLRANGNVSISAPEPR